MSIFNYREKCGEMEPPSGFFTDNYFLIQGGRKKVAAIWQRLDALRCGTGGFCCKGAITKGIDQLLANGRQVGKQYLHAVDLGIFVSAPGGDPLGLEFAAREHGEEADHMGQDLFVGHIRGDHGQELIQQRHSVGNGQVLYLIYQRHQNLMLPVGAVEVRVDIPDPGVGKALLTGHVVNAFC